MKEIIVKNLNAPKDMKKELQLIGFDSSYIDNAFNKYTTKCIKIFNLKPYEATILKQTCLSLNTDCAVHRNVLMNNIEYSNAIITTDKKNYFKIAQKLKSQPFRLKNLSFKILENIQENISSLQIRHKVFNWTTNKYAMGILNLTPDSFSDGGSYKDLNTIYHHIENMIINGISILDIGAESTRPGALEVNSKDEINRLEPFLSKIIKTFKNDLIFSLDTRHSNTAKWALDLGVDIINDVSSFDFDTNMFNIILEYKVPIILMHSSSIPLDMQNKTDYNNLIDDIYLYLYNKSQLLINNGMDKSKIIIDPGIGFGKTYKQNIEIIKNISEFRSLNYPILIALSRKKLVQQSLKHQDSLNNDTLDFYTSIFNTIAFNNGANLIRIHNTNNLNNLLNIANEFIL